MKTKNTLILVTLLITFCIPQIGNTQTSTISTEVYLDLETGDTYVYDFFKGVQVESRFDLRLTWANNNVIVWVPNWGATNLSAAFVLDTSYNEISYAAIDSQTFCTNYGCDNEYLDPLSPNNGIGVSLIINTSEGNYYKIKYQNYDSENYTVTLNYEVMEEVVLPSPFSFNSNETGIQSLNNTASGDTATALGNYTTASEYAATSMGSLTTASGSYSTVMGYTSNASGSAAVAGGWFARASGIASTAFGQNTHAVGDYSFAVGNNNNAEGNYSIALGRDSNAQKSDAIVIGSYASAMGENSIAMGFMSQAQQDNSISIGEGAAAGYGAVSLGSAFAGGDNAVAINGQTQATRAISLMGNSNGEEAFSVYGTAEGKNSVAIGMGSTASGDHSYALGHGLNTSGYGTFAIGMINDDDSNENANTYSPNNTAFVIGNGTDINNQRSNALKVLYDGSTTIAGNVTAPAFIGDGSQLTNLPASTVNYSDIENAPFSYGTHEDIPGIQAYSTTASGAKAFASGDRTKATYSYTTAMGYKSEASNFASTALGKETIASGQYATAMGQQTTASQDASTAMGDGSFASGNAATAMGSFTEAIGIASTAMGQQTKASGLRATAMGLLTEASGVQSTATGFNTIANANQSTAMGVATTAEDFASVSIGQFNKTDETPNPSAFSLQNTAFVIGNGEDTNSRSNALEVLFDGTTTIAGDLNINSDARLKANIISLGATLSKLLQIDGKTYTMKKDTKNKPKIGLLAQEIETVFPELVSETNNIKSVNYQGLVPVLINAIKEQQQEIERLKKQEERLRLLEQKVNTLLNK
mgnify:FL=1